MGKSTQDLGTERVVWRERHWGAGTFFSGGIWKRNMHRHRSMIGEGLPVDSRFYDIGEEGVEIKQRNTHI